MEESNHFGKLICQQETETGDCGEQNKEKKIDFASTTKIEMFILTIWNIHLHNIIIDIS